MRRRIFVFTTVGLASCPRLLAHAQRVGLRHVGWLGANSPAAAGADAILLTNDSVLAGTPVVRLRSIEAPASRRLPLVSSQYAVAADGGLLSMGTDIGAQGRRAAWQVHRILGGAKPGDLAVERPSIFKLRINLKTARALALTVPQSLLLRADEVIQ